MLSLRPTTRRNIPRPPSEAQVRAKEKASNAVVSHQMLPSFCAHTDMHPHVARAKPVNCFWRDLGRCCGQVLQIALHGRRINHIRFLGLRFTWRRWNRPQSPASANAYTGTGQYQNLIHDGLIPPSCPAGPPSIIEIFCAKVNENCAERKESEGKT